MSQFSKYSPMADGAGTVTDVTASSPLASSGGVAPNISLTGLVPIANGGTGQSTAPNALNALLPTQTGHGGEFLTTDGTNASWAASSGGVTTVAALDSQAPNANGLAIVGSNISAQSADATNPGLVNNTTQTFSGDKTFTGIVSADSLSLTNVGGGTINSVGAPLVLLGGVDGISQDLFIEGLNVQVDSAGNFTVNSAGNINLVPTTYVAVNNLPIKNVADPTDPQDAATKNYVDTKPVALSAGSVQDLAAGFTITASSPYIPLTATAGNVTSSAVTAISSGTTVGQLLLLENKDASNYIEIEEAANTKMPNAAKERLYPGSSMLFMWNGTFWVCASNSSNNGGVATTIPIMTETDRNTTYGGAFPPNILVLNTTKKVFSLGSGPVWVDMIPSSLGTITITNLTTSDVTLSDAYGHISADTATLPSVTPLAAAGPGATASAIIAGDTAGKIQLVTDIGATSGDQVTLTYNHPYINSTSVILTPANAATAAAMAAEQYYVTGTILDFTIGFVNASAGLITYEWYYHVIGTN